MSAIKEKQDLISNTADDLARIFNSPEVSEADWVNLLTYCALCIELMKSATPSKLREAARNVELRHYLRDRNANEYASNYRRSRTRKEETLEAQSVPAIKNCPV